MLDKRGTNFKLRDPWTWAREGEREENRSLNEMTQKGVDIIEPQAGKLMSVIPRGRKTAFSPVLFG